jgi:hypothetical protein
MTRGMMAHNTHFRCDLIHINIHTHPQIIPFFFQKFRGENDEK